MCVLFAGKRLGLFGLLGLTSLIASFGFVNETLMSVL